MAGAKLPALRRGQVEALLDEFVPRWKRNGDVIVGVSRDGSSFTIHLLHGGGLRSDQLSRALRYAGITRDEFEVWYRR